MRIQISHHKGSSDMKTNAVQSNWEQTCCRASLCGIWSFSCKAVVWLLKSCNSLRFTCITYMILLCLFLKLDMSSLHLLSILKTSMDIVRNISCCVPQRKMRVSRRQMFHVCMNYPFKWIITKFRIDRGRFGLLRSAFFFYQFPALSGLFVLAAVHCAVIWFSAPDSNTYY